MAFRIDHIHVKALDPKAAADWFVKAFNFTIDSDELRGFGDRFVRCRAEDGTRVNFSGARTGEKLADVIRGVHCGVEHFGIAVDDIVGDIKRLVGLGATVAEDVAEMKNGVRIAFLNTPDGTRIELLQFPK